MLHGDIDKLRMGVALANLGLNFFVKKQLVELSFSKKKYDT